MNDQEPIFVRGVSRSGGTLLVTLLDAHSRVAMSYELYPTLLELPHGPADPTAILTTILQGEARGEKLAGAPEYTKLMRFVYRCRHSGLDAKQLLKILQQHCQAGDHLGDSAGRLRFIARCAQNKMQRLGKTRWGLKCNSRFAEYQAVFPRAYFLNMVRDGRDVLASQLHTGAFEKTPAQIAKGWSQTLQKFRAFMADPQVRAYEVYYERLVCHPQEEVGRICQFLQLPFEPGMLHYYEQDLSLFHSSHLSLERVRQPIDATKIGRWHQEVTTEQLAEFYTVARDTLRLFGYQD